MDDKHLRLNNKDEACVTGREREAPTVETEEILTETEVVGIETVTIEGTGGGDVVSL